ncbi:MAG: DUF2784 domain-containing protein [Acholeplasmataceae bacterium]
MTIQTETYAILADIIVGFHFMYVMFVVVGLLLIVLGGILSWSWVRNITFRIVHLLSIGIVAAQALANVMCPLTIWEYQLRERAGQTADWDISFVGRLFRLFVFHDFPLWFFTVLHVTFFGVVLISLIFIPPRRKTDRRIESY